MDNKTTQVKTGITAVATLAQLNAAKAWVRKADPMCDVDPLTERYEYRVGRAGSSYAGQTGDKLHLVQVSVVLAFDAKKEAKVAKEYPARQSIRWPKVGDISGTNGICNGNRSRSSAVPVDGVDTDKITCSKCLAWLQRNAPVAK
jgi:hypothetical protein